MFTKPERGDAAASGTRCENTMPIGSCPGACVRCSSSDTTSAVYDGTRISRARRVRTASVVWTTIACASRET